MANTKKTVTVETKKPRSRKNTEPEIELNSVAEYEGDTALIRGVKDGKIYLDSPVCAWVDITDCGL